MNKTVNGKHFTILCHVDDLKMLHVDSIIFSRLLAYIDAEYRKFVKMAITQGKIHKYLGVTIYYSFSGKLNLYMVYYVVNILDDVP